MDREGHDSGSAELPAPFLLSCWSLYRSVGPLRGPTRYSLTLRCAPSRPPAARSTYSAAGRRRWRGGGCEVQLSRVRIDRQPGHLEGREAATVDDGT